jgi:hypothetical protein
MMGRGTWLFVGGLFALLAAFALKHALIAIPCRAETAEPGAFDTNRAFARLERILAGEPPHPVDSPGSDLVRDRLLAEMRGVGLQPRVSDDMVCNAFRKAATSLARASATSPPPSDRPTGEHLLIVGHYDSVPVGPGAATTASPSPPCWRSPSSCAASRSPARHLPVQRRRGKRPARRPRLPGPRPAAPRVSHLVNLEARGVDGPAIMFETSRPNGAAVDFIAAPSTARSPTRSAPISTACSPIHGRVGVRGAALDHPQHRHHRQRDRYHTAGDNLAALDRRSLQHMGSQALQLATHYTAGDVPAAAANSSMRPPHPDLVAIPLTSPWCCSASSSCCSATPCPPPRLRRALLACAAAILGAALLAWAATSLIQLIRPGEFWRAYPLATHMLSRLRPARRGAALTLARQASRDQLRVAAGSSSPCRRRASASRSRRRHLLPARPARALLGILLERWRPGRSASPRIAAVLPAPDLAPDHRADGAAAQHQPRLGRRPALRRRALPLLIELRPDGGAGPPALFARSALASQPGRPPCSSRLLAGPPADLHRRARPRLRRPPAQWGIYSDGAPLPEAYDASENGTRAAVRYARRARWLTDTPFEEGPTPQLVKVAEQPAKAAAGSRCGWS